MNSLPKFRMWAGCFLSDPLFLPALLHPRDALVVSVLGCSALCKGFVFSVPSPKNLLGSMCPSQKAAVLASSLCHRHCCLRNPNIPPPCLPWMVVARLFLRQKLGAHTQTLNLTFFPVGLLAAERAPSSFVFCSLCLF